MEFHERLHSLRMELGKDVFEDSDSFRGALDDFMDEGAASTGDINLLVDAVRLGAYRRMMSMIDSGAEPGAAAEAAGDLLSRERGSADIAGSRWACAVLGYAVGKVSAQNIGRYRTNTLDLNAPPQTGGSPPLGTPGPPAPTAAAPPVTSPQRPSFQYPPAEGVPTYQPWSQPEAAAPPAQPWAQPEAAAQFYPPPRKKTRWPTIVMGLALVLVLVVIGGVWWSTRDSGGPGTAAPGGTDTNPPDEPPPTDLPAVDERYQALAANVTASATGCETATVGAGEAEHLACDFRSGVLELATFNGLSDLTAARDKVVNYDIGGRYSEQTSGVFFSQQSDVDKVLLYWDDESAFQSATYVAAPDVKVGRLESLFKSLVGTKVEYPAAPENLDLLTFINNFGNSENCDRVATYDVNETEESLCTQKQSSGFFGHLTDSAKFATSRKKYVGYGRDYDALPTTWNFDDDPNSTDRGMYIEYVNDDGQARIYWDETDCLCYAVVYADDGDVDNLKKKWGWIV